MQRGRRKKSRVTNDVVSGGGTCGIRIREEIQNLNKSLGRTLNRDHIGETEFKPMCSGLNRDKEGTCLNAGGQLGGTSLQERTWGPVQRLLESMDLELDGVIREEAILG